MTAAPAPAPQATPETLYEDKSVQSNIPSETDSFKGIGGALEKRRKVARSKQVRDGAVRYEGEGYPSKQKVAQYDPAMVNQTGPGLPSWQWNSIPFQVDLPGNLQASPSEILCGYLVVHSSYDC